LELIIFQASIYLSLDGNVFSSLIFKMMMMVVVVVAEKRGRRKEGKDEGSLLSQLPLRRFESCCWQQAIVSFSGEIQP
jgi:hypothetical protein